MILLPSGLSAGCLATLTRRPCGMATTAATALHPRPSAGTALPWESPYEKVTPDPRPRVACTCGICSSHSGTTRCRKTRRCGDRLATQRWIRAGPTYSMTLAGPAPGPPPQCRRRPPRAGDDPVHLLPTTPQVISRDPRRRHRRPVAAHARRRARTGRPYRSCRPRRDPPCSPAGAVGCCRSPRCTGPSPPGAGPADRRSTRSGAGTAPPPDEAGHGGAARRIRRADLRARRAHPPCRRARVRDRARQPPRDLPGRLRGDRAGRSARDPARDAGARPASTSCS